MKKKRLEGQLITTRNGFLGYRVQNADRKFYQALFPLLQAKLSCSKVGEFEHFISEDVCSLICEGYELGYGWDHTDGAMIFAFSEQGNKYIEKIASTVEALLQEAEFNEYVRI